MKGRRSSKKSSTKRTYPIFALCVENRGVEASLHRGKVYRIIKPRHGDLPRDVRVVDEEQDDYLYPANWFAEIAVSPEGKKKIAAVIK